MNRCCYFIHFWYFTPLCLQARNNDTYPRTTKLRYISCLMRNTAQNGLWDGKVLVTWKRHVTRKWEMIQKTSSDFISKDKSVAQRGIQMVLQWMSTTSPYGNETVSFLIYPTDTPYSAFDKYIMIQHFVTDICVKNISSRRHHGRVSGQIDTTWYQLTNWLCVFPSS